MAARDDALRQAIGVLADHLTQALVELDVIDALYNEAATEVGQLHTALERLVVIEQAKGVVAERTGVTVTTAWERIRTYARNHNLKAAEVAADVVNGRLNLEGQ